MGDTDKNVLMAKLVEALLHHYDTGITILIAMIYSPPHQGSLLFHKYQGENHFAVEPFFVFIFTHAVSSNNLLFSAETSSAVSRVCFHFPVPSTFPKMFYFCPPPDLMPPLTVTCCHYNKSTSLPDSQAKRANSLWMGTYCPIELLLSIYAR